MNALMSGSWLEGPLALLFLVAAMGANIMPSPRQQSGAVRGLPGDVHTYRHALTRHWGRPKGLGRASVHPCCCRAISSILTLIRHPETSRPGVSCVIARTLSSVGEFSGLSKVTGRSGPPYGGDICGVIYVVIDVVMYVVIGVNYAAGSSFGCGTTAPMVRCGEAEDHFGSWG